MLSLTRKYGERVLLTTREGEEIIVEVGKPKHGGSNVVLHFKAPQSVKILRAELMDEKKEEK